MEHIVNGLIEGFKLLVSFDQEVYSIILLSIAVSMTSTLISSCIGIPFGIIMGLKEFRGKKVVERILYTFMGIPPVVAGLMVALLVSRKGPLGTLDLMYTPVGMIIAQTVLITPIIAGNLFTSTKHKSREIVQTCRTLGAGKIDIFIVLIKELKHYILIGVVTGFGRGMSEVGAIMLVGGNIEGHTRVMTTSIAMNNSMGNYSTSIAMGVVLLIIAFVVNSLLHGKIAGEEYEN